MYLLCSSLHVTLCHVACVSVLRKNFVTQSAVVVRGQIPKQHSNLELSFSWTGFVCMNRKWFDVGIFLGTNVHEHTKRLLFEKRNSSALYLRGPFFHVSSLNRKLQRQHYQASDLSLIKCEVNPEPYPVFGSIFSDFHGTKFSKYPTIYIPWCVKDCAILHVVCDNNLA